MGKLRKLGKKIGRGIKSVGRKLKKGFGKIASAFGKLGPLGTIALSVILPGVGNFLTGMAGTGGVTGFIGDMAVRIGNAAGAVKNGVGKVFNRVTDAIESGMNAVSQPFMKPELTGARGAGSAFRDFVSDATGGFIDKSNVGLEIDGTKITDMTRPQINELRDSGKLETLQNDAQFARKTAKLDARPDLLAKADDIKYAPDGTTEIGVGYTKPTTFKPGSKPVEVQFNKDTLMPNAAPKGINNPTMVFDEASGKYNWYDGDKYETGLNALGDEEVVKTVTNKNYIEGGSSFQGPATPKPTKKSVFAEGDYDSFKGRVKNSREFATFKKLSPIVTVGADMNATADMKRMQQERDAANQAAYFSDVGMKSLAGTTTTDANVSYFDFNNPNPTPEQLFNLENSYSGILGQT